MCSEKRAIAVFQLQSNKAGASLETALGSCVALRLAHGVELILPIRYHREQPISENPDNFTLQRSFRVYKVEGFFTGECGLKQLPQSASFEVLPNYF